MRLASKLFIFAILTTAIHAAHAYATILDSDVGVYFYGMDDSGDVVFRISDNIRCGNTLVDCYETFGGSYGVTSTAPIFDWDYTAGTCEFPQPESSSCVISDNGWTAFIGKKPSGGEGLYGYYGSNPPQLLYTGGFGPIFAINGVGDIVFDDGIFDLWDEAIIPTATTPEPGSFVFLATGMLSIVGAARRRRSQ